MDTPSSTVMFVGSDKFNCKTDGKSYFVEGHIAT
jgi:hypothetical protein